MKPLHIYLDTNAFRYFGIAFEKVPLAADVRDKILISPLSAFEVFPQLGDGNEIHADLVLRQVRALHNWTNPQHSGLLPGPDDMLRTLWFQSPVQDDDFTKRMEQSFNVCLTADTLTPLKEAALQQKQMMGEFKLEMAHDFKNMLDDLKKQQGKTGKNKRAKPVDTTEVWFHGIAHRAHADPSSKTISEIKSLLSAYHPLESKIQSAQPHESERYN
jgi:hypothetical protein